MIMVIRKIKITCPRTKKKEVSFWSEVNNDYDEGERRKLVWPRDSVMVEIDVKEHYFQIIIENDWYKSYEQRMSMFECKRFTVVSVNGVVNIVEILYPAKPKESWIEDEEPESNSTEEEEHSSLIQRPSNRAKNDDDFFPTSKANDRSGYPDNKTTGYKDHDTTGYKDQDTTCCSTIPTVFNCCFLVFL
ncbi:hypothetical protein CAEBREN_00211 [Caenorhabditis brenneri]|uniref:Galectin n=1 Tax=Caenorhabditis brenneri TaxID=135651 RepID=G0NIQ5_CAEBE|nr:hypothetical protein CAEBREN_00211 [Caenorhabditis brenneri]